VDLAGSVVGLVLFVVPLYCVLWIYYRRLDGGSPIYKQVRMGHNGPFTVYKFRSMYLHEPAPGALQVTAKGDPRVTPLGQWLRDIGLDESPQLVNVLFGQMSLIGPRPIPICLHDQCAAVDPSWSLRYTVKTGLLAPGHAGLPTVDIPYDHPVARDLARLPHDHAYVANWSPWRDLVVTVGCIRDIMLGHDPASL
jgi:putative colanic acid biosynthesis UDP-glucose lipid carrier transferase